MKILTALASLEQKFLSLTYRLCYFPKMVSLTCNISISMETGTLYRHKVAEVVLVSNVHAPDWYEVKYVQCTLDCMLYTTGWIMCANHHLLAQVHRKCKTALLITCIPWQVGTWVSNGSVSQKATKRLITLNKMVCQIGKLYLTVTSTMFKLNKNNQEYFVTAHTARYMHRGK